MALLAHSQDGNIRRYFFVYDPAPESFGEDVRQTHPRAFVHGQRSRLVLSFLCGVGVVFNKLRGPVGDPASEVFVPDTPPGSAHIPAQLRPHDPPAVRQVHADDGFDVRAIPVSQVCRLLPPFDTFVLLHVFVSCPLLLCATIKIG